MHVGGGGRALGVCTRARNTGFREQAALRRRRVLHLLSLVVPPSAMSHACLRHSCSHASRKRLCAEPVAHTTPCPAASLACRPPIAAAAAVKRSVVLPASAYVEASAAAALATAGGLAGLIEQLQVRAGAEPQNPWPRFRASDPCAPHRLAQTAMERRLCQSVCRRVGLAPSAAAHRAYVLCRWLNQDGPTQTTGPACIRNTLCLHR